MRGDDRHLRGLAERRACGPVQRAAVIGCGGVGLSAVIGMAAVGAAPIVAVDVDDAKLEAALSLGATDAVRWAGSPEATAEAVQRTTGGGVDDAVEATGRSEAMLAAFLSTRAPRHRGASSASPAPTPWCRCRRSRSRAWSGA